MKQRQKEIVTISITKRTGWSKKSSAPQKEGEKTRETHTQGRRGLPRGRRNQRGEEKREGLTVIFTIPPDAQASGLDSWKTKSNGFTQSSGIDVGYSILVANPPVREIEPLPWDIAIGIWGVVRSKPANSKTRRKKGTAST